MPDGRPETGQLTVTGWAYPTHFQIPALCSAGARSPYGAHFAPVSVDETRPGRVAVDLDGVGCLDVDLAVRWSFHQPRSAYVVEVGGQWLITFPCLRDDPGWRPSGPDTVLLHVGAIHGPCDSPGSCGVGTLLEDHTAAMRALGRRVGERFDRCDECGQSVHEGRGSIRHVFELTSPSVPVPRRLDPPVDYVALCDPCVRRLDIGLDPRIESELLDVHQRPGRPRFLGPQDTEAKRRFIMEWLPRAEARFPGIGQAIRSDVDPLIKVIREVGETRGQLADHEADVVINRWREATGI